VAVVSVGEPMAFEIDREVIPETHTIAGVL
jgi:hypothetical protein